MRIAVAVAVGAVVAVVGGLILGEYELRGAMPYVASVLFGLAVAEAMIVAARRADAAVAAAAGVLTAAGFLWAAWIESGRDWGYVNANSWIAAVVGGAAAAAWFRGFGDRGAGTPPPPADTPAG